MSIITRCLIVVLIIVISAVGVWVTVISGRPSIPVSNIIASSTAPQTIVGNLYVCQGTACIKTRSLEQLPSFPGCYITDSSSSMIFCGSVIVGNIK